MQSYLDVLDTHINQHHMLNHPFYAQWSKGKLTKEQLQEYAKDYYLHIKAFPKYLSTLHSRCDDLQVRRLLLENLMDEEIGKPNHIDLWKRFALALGVTSEELENHQPSSQARKKVSTFLRWCSQGSLAAGVAALYTYESQIPAVAGTKISGLKEFFGFTDPADYEYFTEHHHVDVKHSQEEKKMIEMLSDGDHAQVLQASQEICASLSDFLSSFLNTSELSCNCS